MTDAPERTPIQALVVVDMQQDFFRDVELQRQRDDLIAACNVIIARARTAHVPVFNVRTVHLQDGATWSLNMRQDNAGMVIEGTIGADCVDGLDMTGSIAVVKTQDSAFFETRLAAILQERNITSILLCGVSTESCIAMTAADAYAHDIVVTFAEEATASVDPQLHRRVLSQLDDMYRQPTLKLHEISFTA